MVSKPESPFSSVRKPATFGSPLTQEFIGRTVVVEKSSCKELLDLSGLIVDETLNTFLVKTGEKTLRVPKKSCSYFFPKEGITVNGAKIVCRSWDRTKKLG
ncbi:ribonuclease P protein subunit [Candidatus Micrarchaeota archaeon]|nr:ribonuclease P protein subunit [Candidatus Micrarchaeota archaeon]